jgi:hypothetical protein
VLSTILLALGRADEAVAAAREANRLFAAVGAVHEGDGLIHLSLAEALHAAGQHAAAQEALAAAHARLLSRAAKIEEPVSRKAFMENVRDHVRTVSLAREWGVAT